jgi:predicted nucleic acid-binding Zn ribbon protein
MPRYDYYCEANGQTVEVRHGMDVVLKTWGEVCYAGQIPLGETEFLAPVRKVLSAPGISLPTGNAKLKEVGFTKLVKRDDGVYENVTRTGSEQRYMEAGKPESIPHVHKKVSD